MRTSMVGERRPLPRSYLDPTASQPRSPAGACPLDIHARMTGLCTQMRAPLPAQRIAAADHEFHMLLLQCSGNAALRLLGATPSQSLHRSMLGMREFIASDRRAQLDMARAHDRVLEAVVCSERPARLERDGPSLHAERTHRPPHRAPQRLRGTGNFVAETVTSGGGGELPAMLAETILARCQSEGPRATRCSWPPPRWSSR